MGREEAACGVVPAGCSNDGEMKHAPQLATGVSLVWLTCATAVLAVETNENRGTDWERIPAHAPTWNRYQIYHELVAKGPHAKVSATVFFGAKDNEEFLNAGELPDGTVVVFGNASGPTFPESPKPVLLGSGQRPSTPVSKPAGKEKGKLARDLPSGAGFLTFYTPGLVTLQRVVKFDWGVVSLTDGTISTDGRGLLVAGRCQAAFDSLKGAGPAWRGTGSSCLLRLSVDGGKIEWGWRLEGNPPGNLWQDKAGNIYFDAGGLNRLSADGQELKHVSDRTQQWRFVDADGNGYFGGDRNTHTGCEPWRQPYLYKFDTAGTKLWACWEFSPRDVSSARAGLESDSSVRAVTSRADGNLIVAGWSDGGNSVFQRRATDWRTNCPPAALDWSPWWPQGASSYGHLMVFDPRRQETLAHLWWCGYLPTNFVGGVKYANRTAGQNIRWVVSLAEGAVGFTGGGSTGLIQTPNAFSKDPGDGQKVGGETCVILNKDLSGLLFSSYLPGVSAARPIATKKGMLVVGRATSQARPSLPADESTDGYILLLELPPPQ